MAVLGDRELAGLLSSIAEAPDYPTATSHLLAQLAEITAARRAVMLKVDPAQHSLVAIASNGFDSPPPPFSVSLGDLSSPLVISALSLLPIRGLSELGPRAFDAMTPWVGVPMSQPLQRGALEVMRQERAAELISSRSMTMLSPFDHRVATSPAGVILLAGDIDASAADSAIQLIALASPIVARLAALHEANELTNRLSQHRERLTLVVDSLPDPVVITNASNDIIVQNHRAERLLQARDDDSVGRRRAVELNNLLLTAFLSKAAMSGGVQHGPRELNLVDPDEGNDLLFEVLAHPLGERSGQEDSVLSVLRDVTDLRRAANELERQVQRVRQGEISARGERDRLNLVLENVADPILVTDERSNIILMNDQAEVLFQESESEPRTRRELANVRGNDTKFTSFISEFAMLDDDSRRERMTLVYPRSGTNLPVEVVSGKVKNERGEPIAVVSVLHDLTKQVENERLYDALKKLNSELERRIRDATADLAEQNARLQWQSQEVERANKLKSEFLASMSHELRTPINALIGYTALLLDGVLGDVNGRQRDALMRGRAAAEHLLALINDILDLAKIEAGKMPLRLEEVSLREVTLEVTQQVEPMVRKKQLQFTIDIAPDCPPIYSDRTKIKQILLNLLSNAVKFTNRGRVTVEAHRAVDGVRVDVVDTGIGIRASDLQAIWEDFRQVDQSRTREFGGTGLGLSITRKLLDRLGGSVDVRSTYGEGSTFSVYLPLRLPAAASEYSVIEVSG
ncbi:MAG TPA: ATP-binding protein [Gemmatimonadaceae bacterium]|jgi:PAS domain S-box-containing protein|nr:ATP-binding protein [Gemmatimonadaceae bacterium]